MSTSSTVRNRSGTTMQPGTGLLAPASSHHYVTLADGEWAAAIGQVEATHSGEFLGLPGDGKKKTLRYMDIWQLEDGKIINNWVMLDILDFFKQSGIDLLEGKGWDDRCAGDEVSD